VSASRITLARPNKPERDGWKRTAECDACKWLFEKIKDEVEKEGNDAISEEICDAVGDDFGDAADAICTPLVDPLLAPVCGYALEELFKWLCGKILHWELERLEGEIGTILGLTAECVCFKMGLCPEDACPEDEPPGPPVEPPHDDWWDAECPPAPPEYCEANTAAEEPPAPDAWPSLVHPVGPWR
jgi:hypothetical protein